MTTNHLESAVERLHVTILLGFHINRDQAIQTKRTHIIIKEIEGKQKLQINSMSVSNEKAYLRRYLKKTKPIQKYIDVNKK